MVHPPLISPRMEQLGHVFSTLGSITSLLQLVPIIQIMLRFRRVGNTTGDHLFPHVVDWIVAALTFYEQLISQITTPVEIFGVAAASVALLVHTIFIFVYLFYATQFDRRCAAFYLIPSGLALAITVLVTFISERGTARVIVVEFVGIALSLLAMLLSGIGMVRDWHARKVETSTILDAVIATAHSIFVTIGGHFKRQIQWPEMIRILVGVVQSVLYWYIRAHPRDPPPLLPSSQPHVPPHSQLPLQPLSSSTAQDSPQPSGSPSSSSHQTSPPPSLPPSPPPQQPSPTPSLPPSPPPQQPWPLPSVLVLPPSEQSLPLPSAPLLPPPQGHARPREVLIVVCFLGLVYAFIGPVAVIVCILGLLYIL